MQEMDHNSNKELFKRILVRCILAIVCVVFFLYIFPKLIRMLLPFVIAFIVAAILNPIVNKINQKLGISRRIIALVLDILVFLTVFSLISLLIYSIINESMSLATSIQLNLNTISSKFEKLKESFAWIINILPPQVMEILSGFEESVIVFMQNISKDLLSSVISVTTSITTKVGNFFISFVIAILATYFIIADYNVISEMAKKYAGKRIGRYFSIFKTAIITTLGNFLKAQLLLALSAFLFMLVVLGIYGQPYALIIALFLGIIDLLPIVGTIAILIPWGLIELAGGDVNKGIFLIIVGIVYFIIRKVIEPKIVGSQIGLHPLVALISTYVGLQFSGIWGAILGPIVLMLIISVIKSGIFDNTISDLKTVNNKILKILDKKKSKADE